MLQCSNLINFSRVPDPDLNKDDYEDVLIHKRKGIFLALRIWARQKWSFEWLMKKIPLKRQEQFFNAYRNIYERNGRADLANITNLTDHHIVSIIFQLRWQILVGLERHYIRKPPGPVVATGSAVTKAGSLPTNWLKEQELYERMGKKETLHENIEALKKIESEIRCAIWFPSDEQLTKDNCLTEEDQKTGLKIEQDELHGQISYELGSLYFLQYKYTDAANAFQTTRKCVDKYYLDNQNTATFFNVNLARFKGHELACRAIINKKNGILIEHDAMEHAKKELDNIPDLLINNIKGPKQLSVFQRHQLTQKFVAFAKNENTKFKIRNEIKIMKIRAANSIASLLLEDTLDSVFLSESRKKVMMFTETLKIIGNSIEYEKLSEMEKSKLRDYVTKLLFGIESAHEVSRLQ